MPESHKDSPYVGYGPVRWPRGGIAKPGKVADAIGSDPSKLCAMELGAERVVRQQIFDALARVVADQGELLTREQLSAFPVGGTTRRLIDQSRGIWNPRDLNATLAVVSSPDGPYKDSPIEGGLFRYDYRAGSSDGDNAKLRAAHELDLPILLLLKERAQE